MTPLKPQKGKSEDDIQLRIQLMIPNYNEISHQRLDKAQTQKGGTTDLTQTTKMQRGSQKGTGLGDHRQSQVIITLIPPPT